MKKINKNFIIGGCLFLAFIIFTICVKFVGVESIGPLGSKVGLAGFNELFLVKTTSNLWDLVCDAIMLIAIASGLWFITTSSKRT